MLLFLRAGMQFSGIMVCLDAVVHACTPTATSQQKEKNTHVSQTSFLFTKVAPFTLSHCIIITLKIGGENDVV